MCSHEQYPVHPKGIEHTLTHSQAKTCSQVCRLKVAMPLQTVQAMLWGCSTHQHPGQCQTPASWKAFALSAEHLLHIVHATTLSPKPMAAHLHSATAAFYFAAMWQSFKEHTALLLSSAPCDQARPEEFVWCHSESSIQASYTCITLDIIQQEKLFEAGALWISS